MTTPSKKVGLVTLALAALSASAPLTPAAAQNASAPDSAKGPSVVVAPRLVVGYTDFNLDDLNSRLSAAGLPLVPTRGAALGLGADVRMGRMLLGAGWQSMIGRTSRTEPYETMFTGGVATLSAGVVMLNTGSVIAYPIVGLGGRFLTVSVREREDFSFDDGLSQPRRAVDLTGASLLYDLGAGAEWRVSRAWPISMTLRGGVLRNIGAEHWFAESGEVHGGPREARGMYVQLGVSTTLSRGWPRVQTTAASRD